VGRHDLTEAENVSCWRVETEVRKQGWIQSSLGGTWGTSFALPSPYDLYWKGDSQAIGNPDLNSERSQGGQIWAGCKASGFSIRGAVHLNQVTDLIQWRQVQMFGNAWKPFNIGKAELRNLEI
jgi:outer membrane cobalamin receptor